MKVFKLPLIALLTAGFFILAFTRSTGAPAGFSVQWMSEADLAANGGVWYSSDDPSLCKAAFSGNANGSRYALDAGASVTLTIGDLLMDNGASLENSTDGLNCGTNYVFRVFCSCKQ